MQVCFKILALVWCLSACVSGGKFNVTPAELATCKEYDIRESGYTYQKFFHINTLRNNKVGADERLHLKFYVLTPMDAHILLSPNSRPRMMDRVYEIVIGAGGNTFSTIRSAMGRRRVATNQKSNLLSLFDPTPVEIVQKQDGNLLVYIPDLKADPLMNFTDAIPLNINYISFSTFGMMVARWFYDCGFDGFDSEMKEEERVLTPEQRLIAKISAKGMEKTLPQNLQRVSFAFQIRSVAFNQDASVLMTRMHLLLYWNDTALQWNPEDFNGIDTIVQPTLDIWIPKIVVLNGALKTFHHFQPAYELKVVANGSVFLLATNAEINTWCLNGNRNWPHESVDCEVALGLQEQRPLSEDIIELGYDASAPLSQEPVNTLSEWTFVTITVARLVKGVRARFTDAGIIQSMDGDISIGFTIVRNSSFYKNVFSMPILACQSLVILGFLLRGYRRGALLLVVVIVTCLGMMFITKHAPPAYVPDILIAYQHMLRVTTYCYMLHVFIMWLEMFPPTAKPYDWVMTIVNSSPLRLVLCMRFEDSAEYIAIQEYPWREIAKIVNNVTFVAIAIAFIIIDEMLLPSA